MSKKIIVSGIKPTGTPHMGNYVGALKALVEMSRDNRVFLFVADLHALNTMHNPDEIKKHTYEIAAMLIALGLNLKNAYLFRQSDINQVYKLATLLNNVTPKGLMNRAHAYKAVVEKNIAAQEDVDAGVNMGLYTYPILMAADILLYGSDLVPVGADQKQHVEFARDIAEYFNRIYGKVFKLPEPLISEAGGSIPGLDGRKMSKSYDNTIPLFAPESELKKKIMRIVTDSKTPEEPKDPDTSTIFKLYRNFATDAEIQKFRQMFVAGGMGYGTAKTILFEKINSVLSDARKKYEHLMENPKEIEHVLQLGGRGARVAANRVYNRVRRAMLG